MEGFQIINNPVCSLYYQKMLNPVD